jgi:hypothetical protein
MNCLKIYGAGFSDFSLTCVSNNAREAIGLLPGHADGSSFVAPDDAARVAKVEQASQ